MNRKITFAGVIFAVMSSCSLFVGAYTFNQITPAAMIGYEAITFHLFEGEGCGCIPIYDATVSAVGRTTLHNTSGVTNDDGECVLHLEYDETYRIQIHADGFQTVLFDFNVVDDQSFSFHLAPVNDSVVKHHVFLLQLLQRFQWMKKFIAFRVLSAAYDLQ